VILAGHRLGRAEAFQDFGDTQPVSGDPVVNVGTDFVHDILALRQGHRRKIGLKAADVHL
jgi:hypothetical protein